MSSDFQLIRNSAKAKLVHIGMVDNTIFYFNDLIQADKLTITDAKFLKLGTNILCICYASSDMEGCSLVFYLEKECMLGMETELSHSLST